MRIALSVFDAAKQFRGHVVLGFHWHDKRWFLASDPSAVWQNAGNSKAGSFKLKALKVMEIYDQGHTIVTLQDAPTSRFDRKHVFSLADGSIRSPKNSALTYGKVSWCVENEPVLSQIRQTALVTLDRLLPAVYGSTKWKENPWHSTKPGPTQGYTNCVEFPPWYIHELKQGKTLRAGYPPPTTPGWTDADGVKWPLPGDIFILCKTAKRDSTTTHVGVVYSTDWKNSDSLTWRTADWGQGDGWSGIFLERSFDPVAGTLTGGRIGLRAIKGWVDLDVFMGSAKSTP